MSGLGLNSSNVGVQYQKMTFNQCLWMFLVGGIGWVLLGLYLEAVLPKEYGKKRHPCFMFMPSTYQTNNKSKKTESLD